MSLPCHYCGTTEETRPYGPGGDGLCLPCMEADPLRQEEAERVYDTLLAASSAASPNGGVLMTDEGPVPLPQAVHEAVAAALNRGHPNMDARVAHAIGTAVVEWMRDPVGARGIVPVGPDTLGPYGYTVTVERNYKPLCLDATCTECRPIGGDRG